MLPAATALQGPDHATVSQMLAQMLLALLLLLTFYTKQSRHVDLEDMQTSLKSLPKNVAMVSQHSCLLEHLPGQGLHQTCWLLLGISGPE